MRVIFRADASVMIGTGHVMRCLTLAEALRNEGASCKFVTRDHPGHLADQIVARGFDTVLLKSPVDQANTAPPVHAAWSGVPWQQDAKETREAMGSNPDWLVVDHYAFDSRWQHAITKPGTQIMVIDDLADRSHKADLLLDQNLGRTADEYDGLVPERCKRLIGLRYALLRPEFMARRAVSLSGRLDRPLRHILISMGGTDAVDATSLVLNALRDAALPDNAHLTVVMGSNAPALSRVQKLVAEMPWLAKVAIDVVDMAGLMTEADLAIGAGGGTTWERCCMGLPSIMISTAENQAHSAAIIEKSGAAIFLGSHTDKCLHEKLCRSLSQLFCRKNYNELSASSSRICDGEGTIRVCNAINQLS